MAEDMFRAPINRSMRTLDRSFFKKVVPLKAARVFDVKNISKVKRELQRSRDALFQERLMNVLPDPDSQRASTGNKCVLLRPEVAEHDTQQDNVHQAGDAHEAYSKPWPHSAVVSELAGQGLIEIIPFELRLDYAYWSYHDIITAILPEDEQGEVPSGFTQVGHIAHVNLREEYLKYKQLIAELLMDKNSTVRTVINKTDDVGEESEYRTFKYEVLAGPDKMLVSISEEHCSFTFDYSKVYWNSRLSTEHKRLVSLFKEGEAVCDVMAGVGPFAVPAGKKNVFVWANDLNPDSYTSLAHAIKQNKVYRFVQAFNQDGRSFIRSSTEALLRSPRKAYIRKAPGKKSTRESDNIKTFYEPKTFQHYVLNLPASALTFLPSFIGLYPPKLSALIGSDVAMPLIHVYSFSTKSDGNVEESKKICEEICQQLKYRMELGKIEDGGIEVHDVRDVAPKKRMFCASFRLPKEVAFRND